MADKWIQLQSADGVDNLFPISKLDLLWTNSSPTSSFVAQTVPIDLADYNFVIIEFYYSPGSGDTTNISSIARVGYGNIVMQIYNRKAFRHFTTSTSGVQFYQAVTNASMTGSMAQDNSFIVPVRVYGCK